MEKLEDSKIQRFGIKSLSERHSPPVRKEIVTKPAVAPETIVPVQVVRIQQR
jgi:hypothetical protein